MRFKSVSINYVDSFWHTFNDFAKRVLKIDQVCCLITRKRKDNGKNSHNRRRRNIRFTLEEFFSEEGYEVATAEDYDEAMNIIDVSDFDLILADINLKGKSGIDILEKVKIKKLDCPVVMITAAPDFDTVSDALRLGAYDYVSKPIQLDLLLHHNKDCNAA